MRGSGTLSMPTAQWVRTKSTGTVTAQRRAQLEGRSIAGRTTVGASIAALAISRRRACVSIKRHRDGSG